MTPSASAAAVAIHATRRQWFSFLRKIENAMKIKNIIPLLLLAGCCVASAQTENSKANESAYDDAVVAAINAGTDIAGHLDVASAHRQQTIHALLGIFDDPKADIYKRCFAAKYLGMMRASEAASDLAVNILVTPPIDPHNFEVEPPYGDEPALDALIQIGSPAIPALMHNLTESDDVRVREYSLRCLWLIDGRDRDIVLLRLQKALDAQPNLPDGTKWNRLQSALRTFIENPSRRIWI